MKERVSESRKKLYEKHRNRQKKLKRRDEVIRKQATQIQEEKKLISHLQTKVSKSESQVSILKAKIDRLRHRATYWQSKYAQCSNSSSDEVATLTEESCRKEQALKEEIRDLEMANLELKDQVQDIM